MADYDPEHDEVDLLCQIIELLGKMTTAEQRRTAVYLYDRYVVHPVRGSRGDDDDGGADHAKA